MDLTNKIILIVFSTIVFSTTISCGANREESNREEFNHDFTRAIALRNSKDTEGLESMVKDIQSRWSKKDKHMYGVLMVNTLNSWASACRRSDKKPPMETLRQYAEQILSTFDPNKPDTDNISIESELDLVCIMHGDFDYSKGKLSDQEWIINRRKGTERWFHAWQRLENAIDEDWDPNDIPVENVDLPEGVPGIPGMPPEMIKDPKLRAEYEKAIENNREKTKTRNEQLKLRSIKNRYYGTIEKYLTSTYSIPPYDNAELQKLLNSGVKNKKTKEKFLKAIEEEVFKKQSR
jgi:hypothetical protein